MKQTYASYEVVPITRNTQVRFYTSIDNGSYVAPHWHDAIEIIFMEKGNLTVRDDTGITEMKPGSCLLINANYVHETRCLYPNQAVVMQIPLAFLDAYLPDLHRLRFEINSERTRDPRQVTKIRQLTDKLERMQYINLVSTIFYTGINVPCATMQGLMTTNQYERGALGTFRNLLATAGTMTINTVMYRLTAFFGGGDQYSQRGWTLTTVVLMILFCAITIFQLSVTHERVDPVTGK